MFNFFVVPGNGQVLWGMPDIKTLDILIMNCNTIDIQKADKANKWSTNTNNWQGSRHRQHFKNMMQEAYRPEKCYTNTVSNSKSDNKDKPTIIDNKNSKINYFLLGHNQDNDKRVSTETTQQLQNDFTDVSTGIGCVDGTFSLQVYPDSKPYQALLRNIAYVPKKPFKEELEWLQQPKIITVIGIDGTAEWCNSFVLVPKPNGKVRLCPDWTTLNQTFIRLVHRGPTLNDFFFKLIIQNTFV